jgi:hypothetical protein
MAACVESERVERRTKSHDMMNNNVVVVKKKHNDFLETTLMAEAFLSTIVIASQSTNQMYMREITIHNYFVLVFFYI